MSRGPVSWCGSWALKQDEIVRSYHTSFWCMRVKDMGKCFRLYWEGEGLLITAYLWRHGPSPPLVWEVLGVAHYSPWQPEHSLPCMAPEERQSFDSLFQFSLLTVWHCAGFRLCGSGHWNKKEDMSELHITNCNWLAGAEGLKVSPEQFLH